MEKRDLEIGDVVQIDPSLKDCFFRGCFMIVTEPKTFGAQGAIAMPTSRTDLPGYAYFRATFDQMEYVGKATWILETSHIEG